MDLKLKDKITELVIKNPGISISEVAKLTGNYYSYIHKVIAKMEKENFIEIKKINNGNKFVTKIYANENYKKKWAEELKEFAESVLDNIEIKISLILMYGIIAYNYLKENAFGASNELLKNLLF
jgi:DNA-binding MarR family transcriptional regulator